MGNGCEGREVFAVEGGVNGAPSLLSDLQVFFVHTLHRLIGSSTRCMYTQCMNR